MIQFRTRSTTEQGMKGVTPLDFLENNPKGRPVGSTKNRTTINVSLPAATVASVAKSYKAKKIRSIRGNNHRQVSAAQTIAMLEILPP